MLFLVQQGPIMIEPSLPNATSVNAIMSYQSTISTIAATPEEALDFSLKNNQNNCTSECNIKNFVNPTDTVEHGLEDQIEKTKMAKKSIGSPKNLTSNRLINNHSPIPPSLGVNDTTSFLNDDSSSYNATSTR
jgi:hypothetical protein